MSFVALELLLVELFCQLIDDALFDLYDLCGFSGRPASLRKSTSTLGDPWLLVAFREVERRVSCLLELNVTLNRF